MPTVTAYVRALPTTEGATWTDLGNIYANDGTYVSCTADSDEPPHVIWTFCSPFNIPTGATINSVTVEAKYYVATPSADVRVRLRQRYAGSTYGTTTTHNTNPTTATVITRTYNTDWTVEMLNSGSAGGYLSAETLNAGMTSVVYIDYISLVVDYTEPTTQHDKTLTAVSTTTALSHKLPSKSLSSVTNLPSNITKTAIKLLQTITNISATAAKRAAKSFMHGLTSGASFAWTLIQDAVTYFKELSVGATAAASIRKNALKSAHTPVFCSPRQTKSAGKELQGVTQTTQQSAKKRPYKAITAETTITSRAAKFIRAFITSAITKAKGAVTFPIRILRNVVLRFAERKRDLTVQEQSVTVNIKTGKIDLEVRE